MKVLLATAGYPPDVCGGTERSVQSLARGLLCAGHDVVVVAGTDRFEDGFRVSEDSDADPVSGRTLRVHRIHRDDLFYEHWQKSLAPRVGRAFDDILRAERPDVVHVHHWVCLTRDLVYRATVLGFPTVLSLHDYASSCLIVHRIRTSDLPFCRSKLGTDPCLRCAQSQHPGTPFVSEAEQSELLDSFRRVASRELRSAGQVLVLSRDQGGGHRGACRIGSPGRGSACARGRGGLGSRRPRVATAAAARNRRSTSRLGNVGNAPPPQGRGPDPRGDAEVGGSSASRAARRGRRGRFAVQGGSRRARAALQ